MLQRDEDYFLVDYSDVYLVTILELAAKENPGCLSMGKQLMQMGLYSMQ